MSWILDKSDAPAIRDSEEALDSVYDIIRINKSIGANRFQDALRVRKKSLFWSNQCPELK